MSIDEARAALTSAADDGQVSVRFAVQCENNNDARIARFSDPEGVPKQIDCHLCPELPPHEVTSHNVVVEFVRPPQEDEPTDPTNGQSSSQIASGLAEECNTTSSDQSNLLSSYLDQVDLTELEAVRELEERLMKTLKILVFTADPKAQQQGSAGVGVTEEARAIRSHIQSSIGDDRIEVQAHPAASFGDIRQQLNREKPDIIHFTGHGNRTEILVCDDDGNPERLDGTNLTNLFSIVDDELDLVVLNACYSEDQAQAIADEIGCAVGTADAVYADAATDFAKAFYEAIASGRSIRDAAEFGIAQAEYQRSGSGDSFQICQKNGTESETILVPDD